MLFKIAFRNTLRQKRRTILTALTMCGGFVLASVSIGWAEGSYSYIINMFTRNRLGHIQIHGEGYLDKPSLYNTIDEAGKIGGKIENINGVESWAPRLFASALVSVKDKSAGVQVKGIHPRLENKATRFERKIVKGRGFSGNGENEAVLGKGLADVLNAGLDDEAVIVSQAADGSIANDRYTVVGIISSGDAMEDRRSFYLELSEAQELFVLQGRVHEIAVLCENIDDVDELEQTIASKTDESGLAVATWKEFAKSFYQAMQADLQGMWVMLFVIIFIVSVGVLNTVLMSVLERTREYGLLKAVGTKPRQIFGQVLLEMNIVALASIAVGIGLSLLVNHLLSIHGIDLPTSFTYGGVEFKTMYAEINSRVLTIPSLTVLAAASLVSVFPALRAAKIRAARAMRTQ